MFFEYAKGILWGEEESAALRAVTEKYNKISILDLTGREFLSLFKNFLKGQLVCTLILVVPYFILVYLGILGSPTESPTESPSKLYMGLNLAGVTLIIYWLMQDLKKGFDYSVIKLILRNANENMSQHLTKV